MTENSASDLTLEEKASLTSGADFWTTKAVDRVGIPSVMMTDGPHGLRKQSGSTDHLGLASSVPATCFPPAVGIGSSWDPEIIERVGAAIGVEAAIEDVAVVLGPGINIKRSPLCGRNFEYFSEDPIVSGVLGAASVRGIQSKGVGTSLKHFAANNQEFDRMRASSDVDPRPLREIYLRGFERVVKDASPWTVMCSYNKLNGVWTSEDPWLLTSVLRDDWGFDGLVVSDWGAVNDRVAGVAAGLDLEMPSSGGRTDAQLVAAVRAGELAESVLDTAAGRAIDLVRKAGRRPAVSGPLDVDAHHALAREAAGRSIVLLKNDGALLPLADDQKVAVIGAFATEPRFQGAGSSLINPTRIDEALDGLRALGGFLARLEKGDEGTGPRIGCLGQCLSGAEQPGHVGIVPTGVHCLTRSGVVQAGVLCNGQAVEIGALQDGRAFAVAKDADDSPAEVQHLNSWKFLELIRDNTAGALLLHTELRMLVEILVQGLVPLRGLCCAV